MKVRPLLLALLVLLGPAATALSAAADAASGKRVLVLHSYYKGYKWTDDEHRGISAALEPVLGVENVFVEYMDTKRFFEERYVSQLPEVYRRKYLDHRIDLIVATDDRALEFLVEHRDDVFPGTPVVFCGVNYFRDEKLKGRPLFTGVSEDVDLGASLDTALALHPGTRRIYVVNDDTETGRAVRARLAEIGPSWKGVPLEPLDGLPMEKLLARLRSLPPTSLVFFTFFSRDAEGRVFGYDESIRLVSEASNVPVYGAWDFNLGFGLVGGMLASGFDQGETAGKIALRVLRGESPASIPGREEPPGPLSLRPSSSSSGGASRPPVFRPGARGQPSGVGLLPLPEPDPHRGRGADPPRRPERGPRAEHQPPEAGRGGAPGAPGAARGDDPRPLGAALDGQRGAPAGHPRARADGAGSEDRGGEPAEHLRERGGGDLPVDAVRAIRDGEPRPRRDGRLRLADRHGRGHRRHPEGLLRRARQPGEVRGVARVRRTR